VWFAFEDPELAIPWPPRVTLRSERDRLVPSLATAVKLLAEMK
jgi:hypothetical protein